MSLHYALLAIQILAICALGFACYSFRRLYLNALKDHHDYVMNIRRQLEDLSDLLTGRNDI